MIRYLFIAILTLTAFSTDALAWYNPRTGTFVQRDALGYVDGMNLHRYGASNPLSRVDAMGTCSTCSPPNGTLPGDQDCSGWLKRNPIPTWTVPQNQPGIEATTCDEDRRTREQLIDNSKKYLYPPGMTPNDCFCWEKERIKDKYGGGHWLRVGRCAKLAKDISGGLSNDKCQNALRHCLYACCLYEDYLFKDWTIPDDVLWAHEACAMHTQPNPDWQDHRRDIDANNAGKGCAGKGCLPCCRRYLAQIPGCG